MARLTIDYGIDLGTTNSSIAVLRGTETEVFKNNEGGEITPSAVWLDRKHRFVVGDLAKNQLEADSLNAFCEFKLQMGKRQEYRFARNDQVMTPEELSAEVLKSLRGDVRQRTGEDIQTAVITVPAAFELPQCEATKKAAQLAGFTFSPLLQEPVAAALAYGFQSASDKVHWLVYDFGGGTFDAAVMRVRDGEIHVVNHGGDNHLGGKLIDWAIVEELLIPAVTKEYRLTEFRRGNPKWKPAIAKLKLAAEEAKIRVSRADSTEIVIEFLCQDDRGESVRFEYDLKRRDVERLAEPFIVRSINICKKVLEEKRLGIGNIEKLLLVGGPTLTPYLRDRLADRQEGLGIALDFSADPLTVVARGAAIFAGTQRLEGVALPSARPGQFTVQLEYSPVGADPEPVVGGKVIATDGRKLSGFTIEFVNAEARPAWRSGKLPLAEAGTFVTQVWAERGHPNTFLIELRDGTGTKQETVPESFRYTPGVVFTDPPLTHGVGVALANNEADILIEKGTPLPARGRTLRRTTNDVRRGQTDALIRIPVIEGGNKKRADRNRWIGSLEIPAAQIKRDVPAGSDVEILIEIDKSRLVRTKAYIPVLDEEYEAVLMLEKKAVDHDALKKNVEKEKKRLEETRRKTEQTADLKAQQVLQRIEKENIEHEVQVAIAAAQADSDAGDKAEKRLLDLQLMLDELETALEWPALLAEAEEILKAAKEVVQKYGTNSDKQNAATLERETRQAIESRDPDLLRGKISELYGLRARVLMEQPGWWVGYLEYLEGLKAKMRDHSTADQLIAQGRRAIEQNDLEGLKASVRQLVNLLPEEDRRVAESGYGSSVR